MGLYATTTTLEIRMVNISFDTATSALASEMISDAEAEINKYMARRYDLGAPAFQTSTAIPVTIRMMAYRLSEGFMWKSMSRGSKESLSRAEAMIKEVMTNLEAIATYKGELLDTAGSIVPDMPKTSYRVLSNTSNYANTFNEDRPTSWSVDKTKLDDIKSERD